MTKKEKIKYPNEHDKGKKNNYEGEIKDGKPHGRGTEIYPSGAKYVGEFKGGKRHGKGTYFVEYKEHDIAKKFEGLWEEGQFIENPAESRIYTGSAIRPELMDSDGGWPRVSIWHDREKKRKEYDLEDKWTIDILKKNLKNGFGGSKATFPINKYTCFVMSPDIKMSEDDFVQAFEEFCKENNRKGCFEESVYKTKSFVFDDIKKK